MIKKYIFIILLLIPTLLMTACEHSENNETSTYGLGIDGTPIEKVHEEISFEQQLGTELPVYLFEGFRIWDDSKSVDNMGEYTVSITDTETGEILQTLHFYAVAQNNYSPMWFEDYNFDGYLDLRIHVGQGAGSYGSYEVFLWQPGKSAMRSGGFALIPFVELGGSDFEVFSDTHQFTASGSITAGYSKTLFQIERASDYSDNINLRALRMFNCQFESDEPDNKYVYSVYENHNGEWVAILELVLTPDEPVPEDIIENYLRFGVSDPISTDTAMDKAIAVYGTSDDLAGYKHQYQFKQLLTINSKTYYHITLSKKLGEATYDSMELAVAVDGSEIIDCQWYLNQI